MYYEIWTLTSDVAWVSGKAIFANKTTDKYGRMFYGNHYYLSAGTYDIVFRMKTDAATLSWVVANIGLEGMTSGQVGAYKEIRGTDFTTNNTYKDITITVRTDYSSSDVIPYVYMNGQANLWLTTVIIKTSTSTLSYTLPTGYKSLTWEAENLSRNVWVVVTDTTASGSKAVKSTIAADNYGLMTFGPYYDKLSAGVHKARFRLKTDDYLNTKYIGKLEVYNSDTNSMIRTLQVTGWDFTANNTYQDFDVPYIYTGTGKIEYRTWFYDSGTLLVDKVTDIGLFSDTIAPTSTCFTYSNLSNNLIISFTVSEPLLQTPLLTFSANWYTGSLVFTSLVNNTYNYSFSGTDSLSDGDYSIRANSLVDLLGNTSSNVVLGIATIKYIDLTPPNIISITATPDPANSLDTIDIYFKSNKLLKENPTVLVGDNPATFLSPPSQDIANRYHYTYTVIDSSDSWATVTKNISIRATDLSGNTALNISKTITLNLQNVGTVYETESLPASVGTIISDTQASSWKARKAVVGTDITGGYIEFGPYSNSEIVGTEYLAKFRLKVAVNTSTGTVVVLSANNTLTGKSTTKQLIGTDFTMSNTYQEFSVPFIRGENSFMEYRVQFSGKTDVTDDKVTIVPSGSVNANLFESEDLYGKVWNIITDTLASGGKAVYAKVWKDIAGTLQYGPYYTSLIPWSSYVANFTLKTNANTSTQSIAMIDIYSQATWYHQYKELRALQFTSANTYQSFPIQFIMPTSGQIEFRVFYYGIQDIWSDKVEITSATTNTLPEYEAENLPSLTGNVIVDSAASGNMAIETSASLSQAGTVQFGPYEATNLINNKTYKAVFRIKTNDITNQNFIWSLDVYAGSVNFKKTLEIRGTDFDVNNQYQDFIIIFNKPIDANDLEYRVMSYGKAKLTTDKISIVDGTNAGLPTYESEKLPNQVGKIITDVQASGGKATLFDKTLFAPGWMQFGPYVMDGVNVGQNYKATFRLKVADNTITDPVAIINVYNLDKKIDNQIVLRGTDFSASSQYQDFVIPFTAVDTSYMEFRVYATGKANVTSDKVTITQ